VDAGEPLRRRRTRPGDAAVAPVFEPGDAAIFDQFLLHQTAAGPDYREVRYGFESWFFAPSTYPDPNRWIPIVY
jgi:hypothetical protein